MYKLMIVESPNKIKKIQSFLDNSWKVSASVGHIRDLPPKNLGIDQNLNPIYQISSDKKKIVQKLKSLAEHAEIVYLATDDDREGEAIAYHLKEVLKLNNYQRIKFTEITKIAVLKAINNPTKIDYQMVKAQEARRILDRLVGYIISPVLSQKAQTPLSAGRVQSPTLKIICLRENQINNFRMRKFYTVEIETDMKIKAQLETKPFLIDSEKHIYNKEVADSIADISQVEAESIEQEDKQIKPRAPFITSTLQQVAFKVFSFNPSKTMKIAQSLYESGLISYHRTDTPNLSQESFNEAINYLQTESFSVQPQQITFSTKTNSQEAHEAIKPTDFSKRTAGNNIDESKLYELIRERALTSVLSVGVDKITKISFKSKTTTRGDNNTYAVFQTSGKTVEIVGWRNFPQHEKVKIEDRIIPALPKLHTPIDVTSQVLEKQTTAPSRFTEATLIQALEKLDIGRPSTYAQILENIKKRNYIEISNKKGGYKITPTEVGKSLVESLTTLSFMNLDFTKKLEKQLDRISTGKADYNTLIKAMHQQINDQSKDITINSLIKTQLCPNCSQPIKQLKSKTNGSFWVHCDEEITQQCHQFIPDDQGTPKIPELVDCPGCGFAIIKRYSKKTEGYYWSHQIQNNNQCEKFIKDKNGKPFINSSESA